MPFTVHFEDGIYRAVLEGAFTDDDLLDLARAGAEIEAKHDVVPHRLVDFSGVTEFRFGYEGMNAFARARMSRRFPNDFKSALIAADLVHYGIARMYQTLVGHSQIRVAIFPTAAEGLQWLTLPGLELPEKLWSPPTSPSQPR